MANSMKKFHYLLFAIVGLLASTSAFAQRPATPQATPAARPAAQVTPTPSAPPATTSTALPVSKMGVIYTEAFLDSKNGIVKFTNTLTKLNAEFQKQKDELTQLNQRATTLQSEIDKLKSAPAGTPIDAKSIQTKTDQLDSLKREIQRKAEDAQTAYNRRRGELFAPLQEEIGRALEIFAKARNINVIIDATQVPNPPRQASISPGFVPNSQQNQ